MEGGKIDFIFEKYLNRKELKLLSQPNIRMDNLHTLNSTKEQEKQKKAEDKQRIANEKLRIEQEKQRLADEKIKADQIKADEKADEKKRLADEKIKADQIKADERQQKINEKLKEEQEKANAKQKIIDERVNKFEKHNREQTLTALTAHCTFVSNELIDGQDLQTIIDYLDEIIPQKEQIITTHDGFVINNPVILKEMLTRIHDNSLNTFYFYSKHTPHGRQFAHRTQSYQSIHTVLRHTLAHKYYKDYDMVNCHYVIALNKAEAYDWKCEGIDTYVKHREECINELISLNPQLTKGDVKTIYLKILNGGKKAYTTVKNKTKNLTKVFNEIADIFEKVPLTEEYKTVSAYETGEHTDKWKLTKSIWNKMLCSTENAILMKAVAFMKKMGVDTSHLVLVFDGFMTTMTFDDEFIKNLQLYIYDTLKILVKFIEKPMDKAIDLSKFKIKTVYKQNPNRVVCTNNQLLVDYINHPIDEKLCQIFTHMYGTEYKWNGEMLYYFNGIRWEECNNILKIFTFSNKIYDDLFIKHKRSNKEVYKSINEAYDNIGTTGTAESCLKLFKGAVLDVKFTSKTDSIKGLIGFNNGVLDLRGTPVFRKGLPEDYITLNTRIDFSFIEDEVVALPTSRSEDSAFEEGADSCNNISNPEKFIREIIDECDIEPLLTILGNILIGGNKEQKTTFLTGEGSNGKSLLLNLLEIALGDYANIISLTTYTQPNKNAGGPEAHLVALKGRLLGYTCETGDDKFLSEVFKKMSAEDSVTARGMYSKKHVTFIPLYKPIICTNKLPEFTVFDEAVERRVRIIQFLNKFVKNPDPNDPRQKQIDEDLASIHKTPEFLNEFMNLLIKYSKKIVVPSSNMINAVEQYVKNSNPVREWFENKYMLTTDEKDEDGEVTNIPTSTLLTQYNSYKRAIDVRGNSMTATTFGKFIKQLVEVREYGKSRTKHAIGIKLIETVDEVVQDTLEE